MSPLATAIRESNMMHRETMRHLPTGSPTGADTSRMIDAFHTGRAPLRVVKVDADSYAGVGTVERNRKRAAHRASSEKNVVEKHRNREEIGRTHATETRE